MQIVVVKSYSDFKFDHRITTIWISTILIESTIAISIRNQSIFDVNRSFLIYHWLKDQFKSTLCRLFNRKGSIYIENWSILSKIGQIWSKTTIYIKNDDLNWQFWLKFDQFLIKSTFFELKSNLKSKSRSEFESKSSRR